MNGIPEWWLYVSGLFFIVNLLFFAGMIFVLFKLVAFMQTAQPKIQHLTERVETIATRLEEIADSVKTTTENLGGRAKSVAGSVDLIAHSASKQFEKFSPMIIGVLTTLRLMKAVQEYRRGHSVAAATTQAATDPKKTVAEQVKVDRKLAKRDTK